MIKFGCRYKEKEKMKSCLTCKHWKKSNGDYGFCEKLDFVNGSELAELTDPGSLMTKPNFGCIIWEETK